jgi:hypothetical protein
MSASTTIRGWASSSGAMRAGLGALLSGALLVGSAGQAAAYPRYERMTRAPSSHHFWVGGGYGGYRPHVRYAWYGGRWAAPRPGYRWEGAHWASRGPAYHFAPGYRHHR